MLSGAVVCRSAQGQRSGLFGAGLGAGAAGRCLSQQQQHAGTVFVCSFRSGWSAKIQHHPGGSASSRPQHSIRNRGTNQSMTLSVSGRNLPNKHYIPFREAIHRVVSGPIRAAKACCLAPAEASRPSRRTAGLSRLGRIHDRAFDDPELRLGLPIPNEVRNETDSRSRNSLHPMVTCPRYDVHSPMESQQGRGGSKR